MAGNQPRFPNMHNDARKIKESERLKRGKTKRNADAFVNNSNGMSTASFGGTTSGNALPSVKSTAGGLFGGGFNPGTPSTFDFSTGASTGSNPFAFNSQSSSQPSSSQETVPGFSFGSDSSSGSFNSGSFKFGGGEAKFVPQEDRGGRTDYTEWKDGNDVPLFDNGAMARNSTQPLPGPNHRPEAPASHTQPQFPPPQGFFGAQTTPSPSPVPGQQPFGSQAVPSDASKTNIFSSLQFGKPKPVEASSTQGTSASSAPIQQQQGTASSPLGHGQPKPVEGAPAALKRRDAAEWASLSPLERARRKKANCANSAPAQQPFATPNFDLPSATSSAPSWHQQLGGQPAAKVSTTTSQVPLPAPTPAPAPVIAKEAAGDSRLRQDMMDYVGGTGRHQDVEMGANPTETDSALGTMADKFLDDLYDDTDAPAGEPARSYQQPSHPVHAMEGEAMEGLVRDSEEQAWAPVPSVPQPENPQPEPYDQWQQWEEPSAAYAAEAHVQVGSSMDLDDGEQLDAPMELDAADSRGLDEPSPDSFCEHLGALPDAVRSPFDISQMQPLGLQQERSFGSDNGPYLTDNHHQFSTSVDASSTAAVHGPFGHDTGFAPSNPVPTAQAKPAPIGFGLFGGSAATQNQGAEAAAPTFRSVPATNLFGSSGSNVFGGSSATPAATPLFSGFGQPQGGAPAAAQPAPAPSPAPIFAFGTQPLQAQQQEQQEALPSPSSAVPSLFPASAPASPFVSFNFGSAPAAAPAPTGSVAQSSVASTTSSSAPVTSTSLFGTSSSAAPTSLFGTTASSAPKPLFGTTESSAPKPLFSTTASSTPTSLFGTTASSTSKPLFGTASPSASISSTAPASSVTTSDNSQSAASTSENSQSAASTSEPAQSVAASASPRAQPFAATSPPESQIVNSKSSQNKLGTSDKTMALLEGKDLSGAVAHIPKSLPREKHHQFIAMFRLESLKKAFLQHIKDFSMGGNMIEAARQFQELHDQIVKDCKLKIIPVPDPITGKRRNVTEEDDGHVSKKRTENDSSTGTGFNGFSNGSNDSNASSSTSSTPPVTTASVAAPPTPTASLAPIAPSQSLPSAATATSSPTKSKRKADVQLTKDDDEAEEAALKNGTSSTNGDKSKTSLLFGAVLDSKDNTPASPSPRKIAPLKKRTIAPEPTSPRKIAPLKNSGATSPTKPKANPFSTLATGPSTPAAVSTSPQKPAAAPNPFASLAAVNSPQKPAAASNQFATSLFPAVNTPQKSAGTSTPSATPAAVFKSPEKPAAAPNPFASLAAVNSPQKPAVASTPSAFSTFAAVNTGPEKSAATSTPSGTPKANPFQIKPSTTPSMPSTIQPPKFGAASATPSMPSTLKVPSFGTPGATNFLQQFGQKAESEAKKAMQRAKDEDFDSEEDDEAEWEANYYAKQAEKKKLIEEAAKNKQGAFMIPKAATSPEKSASEESSAAPQSAISSANVSGTSTPAASVPQKPATSNWFQPSPTPSGASTPGSTSIFEGSAVKKPVFTGFSAPTSSKKTPNPFLSDSSDDEEAADKDQKATPVKETTASTAQTPKTPAPSTSNATTPAQESSSGGLFGRISKDASGNPKFDKENAEKAPSALPSTPTPLTTPSLTFVTPAVTPVNLSSIPSVNNPDTIKTGSLSLLGGTPAAFGATSWGSSTPAGPPPQTSNASPTPSLFGHLATPKPSTPGLFSNLGGNKPATTPSLFGSLGGNKPATTGLFGSTGTIGTSENKLNGSTSNTSSLFPSTAASTATSREGSASVADASEDRASPEPQISLTSGGPGEEEETAVHEVRAKALIHEDGKWVTKGLGPLRILRHNQTGTSRVLLRADPSGSVVLNKGLLSGGRYQVNAKTVQFMAAADDGKSIESWILQVKTPESAKDLGDALLKYKP